MPPFVRSFIAFAGAGRVAALLCLMLLGGLVEGLGLALLVPLLALLTNAGGGRLQRVATEMFAAAGATTTLTRLALLVGAFVIVMTVRAAILLARDRTSFSLQARYVEHRRLEVLQSVARAEWQNVAELHHAKVTNALTGDIARIAVAAQTALQVTTSSIMLMAQLALTLAIAPGIGAAAVVLLLAGGTLATRRLRLARAFGEKVRHGGFALAHTVGQLLGGLKQAAAENRQRAFVAAYTATGAGIVAAQLEHQWRVSRLQFAVAVGIAVAGSLVLLAGTWLDTDSAALIAAVLILSRMASPSIGLLRDAEQLAINAPAHQAIEALQEELGRVSAAEGDAAQPPTGPILFDHVDYRHAGEAGGVADISFTMAPGETVGIVGPSGAGKTTLIDLLVGLLTPQSGAIHIGDTRLDDATATAWRERVAYAGQDVFLTNETIRANLSSACDAEVDEAAMWAALDLVRIGATIRTMPHGLDTRLGERGSRLSGGERQRVALARAILRSPALLVLDEATNAIDIATERAILTDLIQARRDLTIAIVAHRTETLRHCTRILRLDRGRLVADDRLSRQARVSAGGTAAR